MASKDNIPLRSINSRNSENPNSESASYESRSAPLEAGTPDNQATIASGNQGDETPIDMFSSSQDAAAPKDAPSAPNGGGQPETRAPAPVFGEGTNPAHSKEPEGHGLLLQQRYQGHSYVDRSYDYMQKYPPDAKGKELETDARAWKVYLDESESYDNDMVKGFRDTIDALLVFAALFSSVVTGFAIETSQTLEPDYAQINVHMLFEQNLLLRAAGNTTQIATVPKSPLGPDSITHSDSDVWVNFMFFASLTLSLATALLAILIKQWLQAFTTLIPGDAKERCLIRQFRFAGLERWRLREIINILPLFLHLALGLFLGGLSIFVYNFHRSIRYAVISIAGSTFAFYFATSALPAIWLDCPYRQPILYIPARIVVYSLQIIQYIIFKGWRLLICRRSSVRRFYQQCPSLPSSTLVSREYHHVKQSIQRLEASTLAWLFIQTTNNSVQRIAIHSVARFLQKRVCRDDKGCQSQRPPGRDLAQKYLPLDAMRSIVVPTLVTATEKLEDDEALREFVLHVSHLRPKLLNLAPEMWLSAKGQHLQLLLQGNMSPMAHYLDPATRTIGYAVHHACSLNDWSLVKNLIPLVPKSHLIDFDYHERTVLGCISESKTIAYEDWTAIVELVRQRNIDINRHNVEAFCKSKLLHRVCYEGKLAAVQYLFSQVGNLDCHVRDLFDETPLHRAVQGSSPNHASIVNILLKRGADVSACSLRGSTVLHEACESTSSPDIIRTLCSTTRGRKYINFPDDNGDTPLLCLFFDVSQMKQSQLLELIQLLISAGADPNIANNKGWVPLHRACGQQHTQCEWAPSLDAVRELFRKTDKEKVNALTDDGETPLDVMTRHSEDWGREFNAISSWMRENGALRARELKNDNGAKGANGSD